jgi:hypothetical protein
MSSLIYYVTLFERIQAHIEQYPSFEPINASAETYALLKQYQQALAQYAEDLTAIETEATAARERFQQEQAAL